MTWLGIDLSTYKPNELNAKSGIITNIKHVSKKRGISKSRNSAFEKYYTSARTIKSKKITLFL